MNYEQLKFETEIEKDDLVFYDLRSGAFDVYGLYDYRNQDAFIRMPQEVADTVNEGVAHIHRESAGGRIRFASDSPYLAIKIEYEQVEPKIQAAMNRQAGCDVYVHTEFGFDFITCITPSDHEKEGFAKCYDFGEKKMRSFTINMPFHGHVKNLYIGLSQDAVIGEGKKYINEKPVVFYGSSITQGASASRPGNTYENIISLRMNLNYTNLGFAGNAFGELTMAEYIKTLDMSAFVSDYDHNAPDPQHLLETHKRLYDIVRSENPKLPYIMATRPYFKSDDLDCIRRREIVLETYHKAIAAGDRNVYFVDGESYFTADEMPFCSSDCVHPNDYALMKMANTIEPVIKKALEYKLK
ncbi:MAG: SGNH/GDSL hydrolase family protein [Eubacteriales bacterium]|nr:SGNH/GDSL hydrolase family protein [Eubacteriales bacterium]